MGSARREGTSNTSVPGSAHRDSTSHDRTTHPGVRIQDGELQLGSRSVPLLSGAVHYFRLPPSSWRPCLRSLRELGLPIVETYVPWGVHELEANAIDFSHPERNLGQFLDAVEAEGLLAFLRPGPHVNAEMTCFGLPEHVVFDSACQARSPRQNPVYLGFPPLMFPVPSYASEVFHGEVARWYEAVGAVVAPRIWPDGPVVMLQVDNEAAYYFRNGPYDQDYHADSITLWHKFLKKRYGSLAKLGLAHRRVYPSWAEVDAPSRFEAHRPEQLPQHLDWAAFQEHVLSGSLRRMRDEMAKSGLSGVPIVHNLPLGDGGLPVSIPAMNRVVDLVGLDYYHGARQHRAIKRRTLYLAGTVDFAYAPELGVGAPPWFTPLTHRDSLFCATAAWAYGIRGFNLYMAVDRDRWYGAPIGHEGTPREEYKDWQRCITVLKEHKFHQLQRKVEVALIFPREYARLSRATHLFGPISPSALEAMGGTPVDGSREDPLGFAGPVQVLWWRFLARMSDALTREGIPYVYIDSSASIDRFEGIRIVVAPTYEFIDDAYWDLLVALSKRDVTILHGPTLPSLDAQMNESPRSALPTGTQVVLDQADDAEALMATLKSRERLRCPFRSSNPAVETSVHEDEHGPRLLFLVHSGLVPTSTSITLDEPCSLRDALTGARVQGETTITLDLLPQTNRILVFEKRAPDPAARQVGSECSI